MSPSRQDVCVSAGSVCVQEAPGRGCGFWGRGEQVPAGQLCPGTQSPFRAESKGKSNVAARMPTSDTFLDGV